MIILAIDPGRETSGVVLYNGIRVLTSASAVDNEELMFQPIQRDAIVCEWIEHYGKDVAAGADVFHTCRWIGRFEQQAIDAGIPFHLVTRREVKLHLCGNMRAKDPQVRQALLDRFGGSKEAKGTKRSPGALHGVYGHAWAALAVAVTWAETRAD